MPIISTEVSSNASYGTSTSVSADGRYIAYLAPYANFTHQLMVKDMQTGSVTAIATPAADASTDIASCKISGDGSKLAYALKSRSDSGTQIYLKDLHTGSVQLASSNAAGVAAKGGSSWEPNLSNDGNFLAFSSGDDSLVTGDTNQKMDVFVKNMQTGAVTLVSQTAAGVHSNASSNKAQISGDGNAVIFHSSATNLASGSSLSENIFVKNLVTGDIRYVNQTSDGKFHAIDKLNSNEVMSSDGSKVALTFLDDLTERVFVKDLQNGNLSTALTDAQGQALLGNSALIGLSADGRYVTMTGLSNAHPSNNPINIVNPDGSIGVGLPLIEGTPEIYQKDLQTGELHTLTPANLAMSVASVTVSANAQHIVAQPDSRLLFTQQDLANNTVSGSTLLLIATKTANSGSNGLDTAWLSGDLAQFTISKQADGLHIIENDSHRTTLLQNIERLQFTDTTLALAGDQHATQAYSLYQAALNRTPDSAGLGYWINQLDKGASANDVAQGFTQAAEFKTLYGQNVSNSALVDKLYQNVLHRAGDADGVHYWNSLLDNHQASPAQVLAGFAASAENQAALVGVFNAGMSFTPYFG